MSKPPCQEAAPIAAPSRRAESRSDQGEGAPERPERLWRTAQPLRLAAGSCRSDERDGAAMPRRPLFVFPLNFAPTVTRKMAASE
uniref:Uncharacterized protein n=1 Tax=Rhizobium rhizogenes TaxID=359 RepID=A0A2Z2PVD9_RHIRH|nr:hypothetical protein [Rhizobium rhizogenes]